MDKRQKLVEEAVEKYGDIYPVNDDLGFSEGFQVCQYLKRISFWFNDKNGSTHLTWRPL